MKGNLAFLGPHQMTAVALAACIYPGKPGKGWGGLRIRYVELWSKRVAPKDSELPAPSHGQVFSGDRTCSRGQHGLGTVTIPDCHLRDQILALVPRSGLIIWFLREMLIVRQLWIRDKDTPVVFGSGCLTGPVRILCAGIPAL